MARLLSSEADESKLVPIAIDLDGTLISADLAIEGLLQAARAPRNWAPLFRSARAGPAALKHEIALRSTIDPTRLPYDRELLGWLRDRHRSGRRLILATGASELPAREIAAHLGIFESVMASTRTLNHVRAAKRDALVKRFGSGGYEWVGSERADRLAAAGAASVHVVPMQDRNGILATVRALRPLHWVKNLLVFLPLVTSHRLFEPPILAPTIGAFAAFCFASSAMYLLNDTMDIEADRSHRTKRLRPITAGEVSPTAALSLSGVLLVASLVTAMVTGGADVALWVALYLAASSVYTVGAKRVAPADTILLAGVYVIRIMAGLEASGVGISYWLIALAFCVFWSLSLAKRATELAAHHGPSPDGTPESSAVFALPGRGWGFDDRPVALAFGAALAAAAIVVLSLYVGSDDVRLLYPRPGFVWASIPLLSLWLARLWLFAWRGAIDVDPVYWGLKDRTTGTLLVLSLLMAGLGALP